MQEFLDLTFANIKTYIKSHVKLFLISYLVLSLGLYILKIPWFLLIAFLITLVDALPVLGSAVVFIPWSIVEFVSGDHRLGWGLLILFVIFETIQNILEPILVGKDLDLSFSLSVLSVVISLLLASNPVTLILSPFVSPVIASIKQYRERNS